MFRTRSVFLDRRQRGVGVCVAGPTAIAELTDRIFRIAEFRMRAGFEIARVARGTIRLIGRSRPGHGLRITTVAVGADQGCAVTKRIWRCRMVEDQRRPEICRMTIATVLAGNKMARRPASGCRAVVTARTRARDVRMIKGRGQPCERCMTVVALRCRRNMPDILVPAVTV